MGLVPGLLCMGILSLGFVQHTDGFVVLLRHPRAPSLQRNHQQLWTMQDKGGHRNMQRTGRGTRRGLPETNLQSVRSTWIEEPEMTDVWFEEPDAGLYWDLDYLGEAFAEASVTEVSDMEDFIARDELSTNSARALILLSALLCGTNFGAVKLLQESADPSMVSAARFLIAAVVTSPFLLQSEAEIVRPAVTSGLWLAIGYCFQALALKTAAAGTTAFLCSLTVVICPILDCLAGNRVSGQAWAAAGLAVFGAAFLELSGSEVPGVGDLFGLLQALSFGLFFWQTEKAMHQFPNQALAISTWQAVTCAVGAALWAAVDAHGIPEVSGLLDTMGHDMTFDLALLWVALVSTALMHVLETIAMGKLSSSETTVIFATEPLWGAAAASLLLGEHIGHGTVVGGSLIVAACVGRVVDLERVRRQTRIVRWAARRRARASRLRREAR